MKTSGSLPIPHQHRSTTLQLRSDKQDKLHRRLLIRLFVYLETQPILLILAPLARGSCLILASPFPFLLFLFSRPAWPFRIVLASMEPPSCQIRIIYPPGARWIGRGNFSKKKKKNWKTGVISIITEYFRPIRGGIRIPFNKDRIKIKFISVSHRMRAPVKISLFFFFFFFFVPGHKYLLQIAHFFPSPRSPSLKRIILEFHRFLVNDKFIPSRQSHH